MQDDLYLIGEPFCGCQLNASLLPGQQEQQRLWSWQAGHYKYFGQSGKWSRSRVLVMHLKEAVIILLGFVGKLLQSLSDVGSEEEKEQEQDML